MSDDSFDGRRRPMQRDWLGHGVQALIVIGAIVGAYVAVNWNLSALSTKVDALQSNVSALQTGQAAVASLTTTTATLSSRMDRNEHDVSVLNTNYANTLSTLGDIKSQLTGINVKIDEFSPKPRR